MNAIVKVTEFYLDGMRHAMTCCYKIKIDAALNMHSMAKDRAFMLIVLK